jgi:aldose sugar dehydrogenase
LELVDASSLLLRTGLSWFWCTFGSDNPFSSDPDNPLSKYYAYGIRNSFGLAFDPLTGNVWMTENGPASNDEINLVKPGFNSGWRPIMGPIA